MKSVFLLTLVLLPSKLPLCLGFQQLLSSGNNCRRTPLFCQKNQNANLRPVEEVCLIGISAAAAFPFLALGWCLPTPAFANDDDAQSTASQHQWMADADTIHSQDAKQRFVTQATNAAAPVTQESIDEYHAMGVTKISNVISQEWLELLRDGCELAQDEYLNQPTDEGIFFTDLEMARRLPMFSAFSLYGQAAAVAGTVMGSTSARYLYDQFFVKEKGVSTTTP
jgi:hypothetical protein